MKANSDPRDAGSFDKTTLDAVRLSLGTASADADAVTGLPSRIDLSYPISNGDDCSLTQSNLSAYLDDELASDEQNFVENHLGGCPVCRKEMDRLMKNDMMIQREWRDSAPLPSLSQRKLAVDAIMDSLPAAPQAQPAFASRRVHARARWMRFSTGLTGLIAFFSLLWSSYRLGYLHGRQSISVPSSPSQIRPVTPPTVRPIRVSFFTDWQRSLGLTTPATAFALTRH